MACTTKKKILYEILRKPVKPDSKVSFSLNTTQSDKCHRKEKFAMSYFFSPFHTFAF